MLSIFVEASCNRYVRDECRFCHVHVPLKPILESREYWHMTPDTARLNNLENLFFSSKKKKILDIKNLMVMQKVLVKY